MSLRSFTSCFALSAGLALAAAGCAAQAPLQTEIADASEADLDAKEDSAHLNLSLADQKAVLFQLNQICGDTWCSGDWEFTFKKIVCKLDLGTCTWTAMIQPSVPVARPVPVYWRSCKVSGVHAFSDLVNTAANGYQSVNWSYYEASTDCVFKIEPKLPTYTPLP
jgi:hypothetical protein